MIASITIVTYAQKLKASEVPINVKASFSKLFPDAIAKWEKEDGNYEANFKETGKNMSATFSPSGSFLESELAVAAADLPTGIASYIVEHYNGAKIKGGSKITKADGSTTYEAEVNGKDVIFDTNSKFIKEEKD